MKHPRLQIARLFADRHIARIEIDRIAIVTRKRFGERGRVWPRPPQCIARGKFDRQKRQSDRNDLRRMPVCLHLTRGERQARGCLFDIDLRQPLQRLWRGQFGAHYTALGRENFDRHQARFLLER